MKKIIVLTVLMVLFLGCETGVRYDENRSKQKVPKSHTPSGLVSHNDIEALLREREEEFVDYDSEDYEKKDYVEKEYIEEDVVKARRASFSSATVGDGLDVRKIREGRHDGYIRLVFDVYNATGAAEIVGRYDAKYNNAKKDITVILHGYQKFSAPLPSFSHDSLIEQIYFEQYPASGGFKFHIKLRENASVKIFNLKNPARIVFDIKSI